MYKVLGSAVVIVAAIFVKQHSDWVFSPIVVISG